MNNAVLIIYCVHTNTVVCRLWAKLTSVAVVETHRRHYIASLPSTSGEQFAQLLRNHGSIANDQHWILDIAFKEDQNRVGKNHGDQNLAKLRPMALGLLRRDRSGKLGVKNKRLKAGRNRDYLLKVLLSPAWVKEFCPAHRGFFTPSPLRLWPNPLSWYPAP